MVLDCLVTMRAFLSTYGSGDQLSYNACPTYLVPMTGDLFSVILVQIHTPYVSKHRIRSIMMSLSYACIDT